MLGRLGIAELIVVPITLVLPAFILYFIVKLSVKHAIRELKKDGTL